MKTVQKKGAASGLTAADVFATIDEAQAQRANDDNARRAADATLYCQILTRLDDPQPDDARDLAAMIADGFITRGMLQKHFDAVTELRHLIELNDGRAQATEQLKAVADKREATEKRVAQELRDVESELATARNHSSLCHGAAREIAVLLGECKHFREGGIAALLGYKGPA